MILVVSWHDKAIRDGRHVQALDLDVQILGASFTSILGELKSQVATAVNDDVLIKPSRYSGIRESQQGYKDLSIGHYCLCHYGAFAIRTP